jgi:endonuclease YncB( thermonuclease family)
VNRVLSLLLTIVLLFCSTARLAHAQADDGPRIEALITRVVDGSTLDAQVEGARTPVGYLGVSVPDINQPCGEQAFERNRELTGQGVLLESDPLYTVDDRHRQLFYAYTLDGVSIDETLIREGLAHATRTDAAHGADLAAVEADAAASAQGCLWSSGT